MSEAIIRIRGLKKTYKGGHQALKGVDLDIRRGEIFALLGPNGAGKTTLIGIVCGLVRPTEGTVEVDGFDIVRDYRKARQAIGLVPQEMSIDMFGKLFDLVRFTRGLFGKPRNDKLIESLLRDLSLWDKRNNKIAMLSGGMKRRVLIAKALSHEPSVLFLDEPTAGVDVELRREMWEMIGRLRDQGVTIILTTHYIEEAEEMADRIGVIDKGELILVEDKAALLSKLGRTEVEIGLKTALASVPAALAAWPLSLSEDGLTLTYAFTEGEGSEDGHVADLLKTLAANEIDFRAINTHRSSLEDIFVTLVAGK